MFTSSSRAHDAAILRFTGREPLDRVDALRYGRGLAAGTYRREWTWLAFVDDTPDAAPVARGVWWGPVGSVHPVALHCLLVDESLPHPEVWGAALIRSAHRAFAEAGAILAPDLVVEELPGTDPADAAVQAAVAWRRAAAADAGLPLESVDGSRRTFSARLAPAPRARALAGTGR
ncbi:hypothetical protein [Herbiconiux sp. A18JL235]|uniref:GNAT family N-acetyltransferase n=1 Tax=Herbiconiux sp. A18JL235 TaxID=3152363 RepID=A0AB39BJJ1_9MICO